MNVTRYNCPHCHRPLLHVIERELDPKRARQFDNQRTHVYAGAYVERRPIGIEVVGECPMHGLVVNIPLGIPTKI